MVRRIFAAALGVLVVACAEPPEVGIATVGDRPVRAEAFQRYLEGITGGPWSAVDDRVAARLLDQFLDQEVIMEAARRRGLLQREPREAERERVVRELLARLCGPPPTPDPAGVEAEVVRRRKTPVPARVRVRQLVFEEEGKARKALALLRGGESWEQVSRRMSEAPNAAEGGSLGTLMKGQLPDPMDRVLFSLEHGEYSGPVRGPGGYHIFQVLEREPGGPPELEELRRRVREELAGDLARRAMAGCLERIESEIGVAVHPRRLWFRYDGRRTEERHEAG